MPRKPKHDAIARQWELLRLLPARGFGKSPYELSLDLAAQGFPVGTRTVQRDLILLSSQFALQSDETTKPYRWRWAAGAQTDLRGMDVAEAISLRLLERYLEPLLPGPLLTYMQGRFMLARDKLTSLAPGHKATHWSNKVAVVQPALNLLSPVIAEGVLDIVQEALLFDEQLDVVYRRISDGRPTAMRLHPLGLVQRGAVLYLATTITDYTDVRVLAVHRILSANRSGRPMKRPLGFSLEDFIASGALEFGSGMPGQIKFKARISIGLSRHLEETPLSADMELRAHGRSVIVTATMRNTWPLYWWVLSQGSDVVVIKPEKLRRQVVASHREALAAYAAN